MKPSLPQGTRDFNSTTIAKRQYILNTIKHQFELHGYTPLETPSIENLNTLTGKYGEEGDRLIFKIINNGLNEAAKHDKTRAALENVLQGKTDINLTDRALRYDLTIPFARYVAMNRNDIALPYKRYQMQPVWRADRPQRGRYREFWQCDADIVGSNSLINEAELLNIYYKAFEALAVPQITISINNRKILAALAEHIGSISYLTDITIAIDKLDKIGLDKVIEELQNKGLSADNIKVIKSYLSISGDNETMLVALQNLLGNNATAMLGIQELKNILNYLQLINPNYTPKLDFTLARGLDYYTGMIVEVKTTAVQMGSIGGGGRYDNLTGVFDYPNVSGVGISFGVDRIFDVMEELNLFSANLEQNNTLLFVNLGATEAEQCLQYISTLRNKQIACELYPDTTKMDKQLKYANKRNYKYVAIVGSTELANNNITLKNFESGEQHTVTLNTISEYL
jgi:histidyl-tRNA synthetase